MTRPMERLTRQMITGNAEPTTREGVQRELERLWDLWDDEARNELGLEALS